MKNTIYISYNLSFIGIQSTGSYIGLWVLLFFISAVTAVHLLCPKHQGNYSLCRFYR